MTQEISNVNDDEKNLTLKEKMQLRRKSSKTDALLLDCSSSMAIDIEPGKSRHQALKDIVSQVNYKGKTFYFSSSYQEIKPNDPIPEPNGGTHLSELLKHLKSIGCKSCLIITDGEIGDQSWVREVLKEESELRIKVMFVGSHKPAFLDELATDGNATVEDLKQTKQLAEKLQLLLSAGESPTQKGPIQL